MNVIRLIAIVLIAVAISYGQQDDIGEGNRKFTAKLFKELLKENPNKNIIFAPVSVQILMALLTSATRINGPAIKEIISKVELPPKDKIPERFKSLTEDLNKRSDDFKIFSANKMYFGDGCVVQKWFKTGAKDNFNAETEIIDFQYADNAAGIMNFWVSEKTNNKIDNFIQEDQVPPNTKIFLINALYLMGKWEIPFETRLTVRDSFYIGPGRVKEVHMMKISGSTYGYYDDKQAQYLRLGLNRSHGEAELIIVLPLNKLGLAALTEKHLDEALFPQAFVNAEMTISFPKFNFTNDVPLKASLNKLGVNKIFENGVIMEGYNYGGSIDNHISDVFQKVTINVDETGVTAIGTSAGSGYIDDAFGLDKKDFIADHPFLFYIRVDDVIVYAGQVLEP